MEEKTGQITDIIFHNEENGYTIGIMETETEYFTVVGCLPGCLKGVTYKLRGSFKIHPVYGEQFAFNEFEQVKPTGAKAVERFLASGTIKGIGEKAAAAIVGHFGEDSLRIIEEEPERLQEIS